MMERIWIYYYSFLLMVLIVGMGYYFISSIADHARISEHFIGVNLTKDNGTCRLTWLGGWDYDSFYTNVTVNGDNLGHPAPMTVLFNDTCRDLVVKMHDRAVRSDITLYRYNYTGVSL